MASASQNTASRQSRPKNLVVAQSGGPSPVINNTLRGIIEAARDYAGIGRIYAARHGIEGVLKEELLDLSAQDPDEVARLRYTPAAGAIGTCRYKLLPKHEEDFARCIDVFRAHDVGYFIYIGGNDSMDTADKIARLAQERGLDLVGIGGPKTIDNDVGDSEFRLIDHTPGYGSTAKYWLHAVAYANEENAGSSPADPVLVLQAMGRRIGFIPAAARLADPERTMPLQIYLAERSWSLEEIADRINDQLKRDGRCVVVVSEGLKVGDFGKVEDTFGHVQFSSSEMTVCQVLVNHLNRVGLAARGAARGNVAGTDQRHSMAYASSVDLSEGYEVGRICASFAAEGRSGLMGTILREPGPSYSVRYDGVPLGDVANSERTFPADWIAPEGNDVTDDFIRYARPLVGEDMIAIPLLGGRPRMTRFEPVFAAQKLPAYVPQGHRPSA